MRILRFLKNTFPAYAILVVLACLCSSCFNTRKLVYMQGNFDTTKLSQIPNIEPVIHKGDLLSIIVYSDNPDATKIYNQTLIVTGGSAAASGAGAASAGIGPTPTTSGYLVDDDGNIEFQGLGLIHVDSLTRAQLKDTITHRLDSVLENPYCTVRFLNYRFTMLGEVAKPGIFSIPGDHVNLLEALGMAGDMTFYGRRDNILVVRENNGKRNFGRMDITKPDIMASPYFYLQPNDVVIVEPTKKKVGANDQTTIRTISIASSIISTLALLYTIFR